MNYNQSVGASKVILCIPDTQAPFEHPDALPFLSAVSDFFQPTDVVHLGDEVDQHALGRWPKDPDGYSAGLEHQNSLIFLHALWDLFPKMKICTSNHTVRAWKKAFEAGIPKAFLRSYAEAMEAPATVEWRDRWVIDNIVFEHGEGVSGKYAAVRAAEANRKSTVIGHIHSFAGIQYSASFENLIFGFNTGCLINVQAYAFKYGEKIRNKPVLGCGIIVHGVPFFIPLMERADKRWNSKLQKSFFTTMSKTVKNL